MADFQTQFKPASPEPICSSWIFILTLLFKQLVDMNEFLVMCAYVCELYAGECAGCLEKKSWHFTTICTHTPKTNPFYLYCMLFICSPWHPPPWCDLSETQHSRVLSQCEEEEPFFRNSSNQCADVASYYTLYFHVHVKKITLCS